MDNINYKVIASGDRLQRFSHESTMLDGVISVVTKRIKVFGREIHLQQKLDLHKGADLVISEYGLKNLLVYYMIFFRRPKRFAFWGHGQTTTRQTLRIENAFQKKLLARSDYFFAYTQSCSDYLDSVGFPSSRVKVLNNSIDTISLRDLNVDASDLISQISRTFCLSGEDDVFLYIGSLETDKRIDFLLDAFNQLASLRPRVVLLICSQDKFEKPTSRHLPNRTHFIGEADEATKKALSQISIAILNPGRVGLIAVDSFALGLPILTTEWTRHAPEFSYLQNEINSLITSNSLDSYVQGCLKLLDDSAIRKRLVQGCIESSKKYTVEQMAHNFHAGVLRCLESR
jgi:glycosyltransferase involved in cell wall biosynthesis